MEKQKTHWRTYINPDYLGAYCMPQDGSSLTLTIKSITREIVVGDKGKKEECTIAHFKEDGIKPMILNRTNCKAIQSIYKTPFVEDWVGKRIEVKVEMVESKGGEQVEGLRIVKKRPELPELKLGSDQFNKAKGYIAKGNDIKNIEANYKLTDEVKKALLDGGTK